MSEILSKNEIEQFILDGFVRIDNAFSQEVAGAALDILWEDLPCDRSDPTTWTEPVIRLGMYTDQPFIDSISTPKLHNAFNQLVGVDKWFPCRSVGTFPVRFPSSQVPIDTGKHVDASFPGTDPGNYMEWRVNIKSKGRALLMLVLYSDVSDADAPTVIYKGSHLDVARVLSKEDDWGLSFMTLANKLELLPKREEVYATGKAGTVYLCHPFLVHSAQAHRGNIPKFMAQPPLLLKRELSIGDSDVDHSPVERAIRLALKKQERGGHYKRLFFDSLFF
ncbi:phytanoyl-CoA dioxygenase family protein [Lunatibacter salilacus]|uniref:phytanoyl-CoA dioxygenase n=1 Tax=Lunatibacter salilacus TaxID=2483804 RepID=UPI00131C62D1|nr:phytanoyl-CoA dioxygenase [Lunatibacter salilacus]